MIKDWIWGGYDPFPQTRKELVRRNLPFYGSSPSDVESIPIAICAQFRDLALAVLHH